MVGTSHHVGGQARGLERADVLGGGDEHLAAHVAALLLGGELVLVVDPGRAGLDHVLHQLVGVDRAAEAGFGVGHDRQVVVDRVAALEPVDLVGAHQRVVEPLDQRRHAVDRVEALVGVGRAGGVGVGGDLPAGDVDGLQAGLGHLHGLGAGDGAEGADEVGVLHAVPEPLGAVPRDRGLGHYAGAQLDHVLGGVVALDAAPAGEFPPAPFELFRLRERRGGSVLAHSGSPCCFPPVPATGWVRSVARLAAAFRAAVPSSGTRTRGG